MLFKVLIISVVNSSVVLIGYKLMITGSELFLIVDLVVLSVRK